MLTIKAVSRCLEFTLDSQLTYPSAEVSHVWQRPVGDSMFAFANTSKTRGSNSSLAPATNAMSHLPICNAKTAASRATKEDEHAVSYTALGPWKLNTYEIRPDAPDVAEPVPPYTDVFFL